MAVKYRAKKVKRLKNAAHAARFPRRDKEQKKWERHQRTLARERKWLADNEIERDDRWPLA